jgi:predicted nucleotidyltransferase component of viral defense system
MGKTILTPKQLEFLEFAQKDKQVTGLFYLTGGTALSEFYLHHRLSEDIDLFTEKQEVDQKLVEAFLKEASPTLGVVKIKRSEFLGLKSYKLVFTDKEELKIDFSYYPFPRIGKGVKYKNLEIDSIYDIAVNKIHTLFMKPRERDYVDIYFIMKSKRYSLKKLILDAKAKFDWDIDRIKLASHFVRVKDFKDTPKVLLPFDRNEMEEFYLKLAKSLEKEIFK